MTYGNKLRDFREINVTCCPHWFISKSTKDRRHHWKTLAMSRDDSIFDLTRSFVDLVSVIR